jgi:hypothetical protein
VQVLDRREVFLERVGMAAERELGAIFIAERVDRLAVPTHFAALRTREAAEDSQQARLAAAVRALHLQAFAGCNPERDPGEKAPRSTQTFQVVRIEHRDFPAGPTGMIDAGQSAG